MVYCLLEGPFIYYAKPIYTYNADVGNGYYVGASRYIEHVFGFSVTLFGFFIAMSRMRDKLIRARLWNLWFHITCRRNKKIKFDEFERLVEKS